MNRDGLGPAPATVSAIIPTYNAERYVAEAIDSALGQTSPPNEVIVVDDGSTDGTVNVVRRYGDRVVLLQQPNRGPAAARNVGLKAAHSEFIAFLDADDVWSPRNLELQVAILRDNPRCVMSYGDIRWFTNSPHPDVMNAGPSDDLYMPEGDVAPDLIRHFLWATPAVVARREIVLKLGGFDETLRIGEDYDLWLRLASAGPVARVRRLVVACRAHPESTTKTGGYFTIPPPIRVIRRHLHRVPALRDRVGRRELRHRFSGCYLDLALHELDRSLFMASVLHFTVAIALAPTQLRMLKAYVRSLARSVFVRTLGIDPAPLKRRLQHTIGATPGPGGREASASPPPLPMTSPGTPADRSAGENAVGQAWAPSPNTPVHRKHPMSLPKSTSLWNEFGKHLLACQPFADNIIAQGDGCFLVDVDGNRILDLASGQFCNLLGYGHPALTERIVEQVRRIVHTPDQMIADVVLEAAAALADIAPVPGARALLLSTGSEANECALRVAKTITQRTGTLGFTRGYYGISLATRNISRISLSHGRQDFQPVPPGGYQLLTPDCAHCPIGLSHPTCQSHCLRTSLQQLGDLVENVGAIFVEPVLSAGGMVFPPEDYLQRLATVAKSVGALLVVDEAQTGFGRTGKWFCVEHYGIEPDILVISKGTGAGYPGAGIIVTEKVAGRLGNAGFTHLSSHQNDPLAAAALLALIQTIRGEGLMQRALDMGEYFMKGLRSLQTAFPERIIDVRGRGLMIGMELADQDEPDGPASLFGRLCARQGVHVTYAYDGRTLRLIPPLTIGTGEINHALKVFEDVLRRMQTGQFDSNDGMPTNACARTLLDQWQSRFPLQRYLRRMWATTPAQWFARLKRDGTENQD